MEDLSRPKKKLTISWKNVQTLSNSHVTDYFKALCFAFQDIFLSIVTLTTQAEVANLGSLFPYG